MDHSFQVIKNNLIGGVASAMLTLKKIKEKIGSSNELKRSLDLIDFLEVAVTDNYKDLLYDKHFIVSEQALVNIHDELRRKEVFDKINFKEVKEILEKIQDNSGGHQIEEGIQKLKEIAVILRGLNYQSQTYM